jgi:hypothetical protein
VKLPLEAAGSFVPYCPDSFTLFDGPFEIQRMIIGRAITGLDVRWA